MDKCLWALWFQCVKFMHGKGDKYDVIKKEMPHRWLNNKTSSELLVITPTKLS
jgi:DNA-nicking Smr family endonuclease